MCNIYAFELMEKYIDSAKIIEQNLHYHQDDEKQTQHMINEFEKVLSVRQKWKCTLKEIQQLSDTLKKNFYEICRYVKEKNPNVCFMLPCGILYDPSMLKK